VNSDGNAVHGNVSLSVIELVRTQWLKIDERQKRKRKNVPGMRSDSVERCQDWSAKQ